MNDSAFRGGGDYFTDALARLKASIAKRIPRAATASFSFYHLRDAALIFGMDFISSGHLVDEAALKVQIDAFRAEGREWAGLAGEGFDSRGRYICVVDRSSTTGVPGFRVDVSGATLESDGSPRLAAQLHIDLLERVASDLRHEGLADEAEEVLACYGRRHAGDWSNQRLSSLSRAALRVFVHTVRELTVEDADKKSGTFSVDYKARNAWKLLTSMSADPRLM